MINVLRMKKEEVGELTGNHVNIRLNIRGWGL